MNKTIGPALRLLLCLAIAVSAASLRAGDIVPGLDDASAIFDTTVAQAGTADEITPVEGGAITFAARFTPASTDLTAAGPVILIEVGGTSFGNGLYIAGGNLIFATKGANGGNGNYTTQTGLNDLDASDAAAAVTIAPLAAGALTELYASFDPATGNLLTSINGARSEYLISGTIAAANLTGNESVSFLGSGTIIVGELGGLTNAPMGQGDLWNANLAVNFTGQTGPVRGQIFAAFAPQPYSLAISQTDGGTFVTEDDLNDTFSLSLTDNPQTWPVTVTLSDLSNPLQVTLSPDQFVFTSANWQTPQTVNVAAIDDSDGEQKIHTTLIGFQVQVDPASPYAAAVPANLLVSIGDNDCTTWGFHEADLNKDCQIDLNDLALFQAAWLDCTMPIPGCLDYRP